MDLEDYNEKLERSSLYIFVQRHKKVLNVIQGLFIIGLLIGINTYVVKDYFIKEQIADHCGYTTSRYECICEKNYIENYKEMQIGNHTINYIGEPDVAG